MIIDFGDPASIAVWIGLWPARHIEILRALYPIEPQWQEAIRSGVALHTARTCAAQERDQGEAQ